MNVGIRDLKRHLSEYLERAASGEVIRVTDHGRAKAILGPLPQGPRLEEGIAEGWIRAGREGGATPVRRQCAERGVSEVLEADRGG